MEEGPWRWKFGPEQFVCAISKATAEASFTTRSLWVHGDIKEAAHSPSFSLSIFFSIFLKSTCTSGFAPPQSARSPPPDTNRLRFIPLLTRFPSSKVRTAFILFVSNYFHMWKLRNLSRCSRSHIYQVLFTVCLGNATLFASRGSNLAGPGAPQQNKLSRLNNSWKLNSSLSWNSFWLRLTESHRWVQVSFERDQSNSTSPAFLLLGPTSNLQRRK